MKNIAQKQISHENKDAERIALALGGKRSGNCWMCPCPVPGHGKGNGDRKPSLSIMQGKEGPIFNCFAKCSIHSIINVLKERGVWIIDRNKKNEKKEIANYSYQNEHGQELYQRIRFIPKSFCYRRSNGTGGYFYKLGDVQRVLYNLPGILDAREELKPVIYVEGEKDADTLNKGGFIATTSGGVKDWRKEYVDALTGNDVIIIGDNDEPGREHSEQVGRSLYGKTKSLKVVLLPLKFKDTDIKDVSDFFDAGGSKEDLQKLIDETPEYEPTESPEQTTSDKKSKSKNKKGDEEDKPPTPPQEYWRFIFNDLPDFIEHRRDLISDKLMVKNKEGNWQPISNRLEYIYGHMRNATPKDESKGYDIRAVSDFIERYRVDIAQKRLLIDIPVWDGVDRIEEIANICKFSDLSSREGREVILKFGTNIFKRLNDHTFQPPMLLFQGGQGLGKDTLIKALTDGFGNYSKEFNISRFDLEEAMLTLHTALVFKLSEFDRISEDQVAELKYLLTVSSTDLRLKYGRTDEKRIVRASFIGSVNPKQPLQDVTGNRRFWIVRLTYIGFNEITNKPEQIYPGHFLRPNHKEEQLQIIAQFKHYFENKLLTMSEETSEKMRQIMTDSTPDDPSHELIRRADELVIEQSLTPNKNVKGENWYGMKSLQGILTILVDEFKITRQSILHKFFKAGRRKAGPGHTRMYHLGLITFSNEKTESRDEIDFLELEGDQRDYGEASREALE